ncbi:MAG: hypothetical protein ACI8V2_001407 [Candidatus Latescibacterota bacterium]|jgi:hypothetical protein
MRRWLVGLILTGWFIPNFAFAQSVVLLDANSASGYQGATRVEAVQSGQEIVVEVVGREITGISGFSAQIIFDASQLSFNGFVSGNAIPDFTGLNIAQGSGTIEIGGASVSGSASTTKGQLGLVKFRVLDGFSGDATVALGLVSISKQGTKESVPTNSQIVIGPTANEALVVDADLTSGHQGGFSILDTQVGDVLLVEIYGHNLMGASGFSAVFDFDPTQLSFDGFDATQIIPNLTGLRLNTGGAVEIGGASVTGTSGVSEGRLGVVRFKVLSTFSGEASIKLIGGRLTIGTDISNYTSDLIVSVTGIAGSGPVVKTPDFNGNGKVDFPDFLMFASAFGKRLGDVGYQAAIDLDDSGAIDFPDFLTFAQQFGK